MGDEAEPQELDVEARAELARAMVPDLKQLAPKLLVAAVLPLVAYQLLRPHVRSDATALAAVMVFPIADVLLERRRHGRFEPIGIIALLGIGFGLLGAAVSGGDALLLKLRESVLLAVFGVACLASLAARRPMMFHLGRAFATAGDAEKAATFEQLWEQPGAPRRFRRTTAVWGVGLLSETTVRTILALSLPTSTFLAIAPVLGFGVTGGLIAFSVRAIRAGTAEAVAELSPGPAAAPA
jgi:hypothetical protein